MVSKRLLRMCVCPLFWFVCRGFPACPICQSWNGTISGFSGDNGKTHGYPDYAPPTIKHHYCLQCKHVWTSRYRQLPDWYYAIRCWPARLMSNRTYHRILDKIDYSIPQDAYKGR